MDDTTPQADMAVQAERLKHPTSIPADCTDEELAQADFTARDVLVGTVRSDAQLDHTLTSLSYYTPARALPAEHLPVRMIALYEEGLTRLPGIKRYGEVTETRVVRREEIPIPMSRPNGSEAYYLFTVKEWTCLDHPIALEGTSRGRPAFTTEFLLTHARLSYQLVAIHSPAEYRLAQVLCALCAEAAERGSPVFRRIGEGHVLSAAEGSLSLIHARGEVLYRCPLWNMKTHPAEVLGGIALRLGLR